MNNAPDKVEIRGLRKHYGSTKALDGLDLDLRPGEVLGIAGPNGAGKSTLIRILAGEEQADAGELLMDGRSFTPGASVAVVHQEPELFPNLTIAENLRVGRESNRLLWPRADSADRELMEAIGISAVAGRLLGDCTLAVQQRTEIARALVREARVFLFDEPNSALTKEESDELFHEMHALAAGGHIVVLVTHRLDDLVAHTRRVAIIRDGSVTALLEGAALTEEAVAQHLVLIQDSEREAQVHKLGAAQAAARQLVEVHHWSHAEGVFSDIDFSVAEGEIVALMGVEGSGARELLQSLAGLAVSTGSIRVGDLTGASAIEVTSFVPASRQHSLYSNLSVGGNLVVRFGQEIAGLGGRLRGAHMRTMAEDAMRHFLVRARDIGQPIRTLSGGNQQKVAIAQALARDPLLVLLEEPTRGVDIGSRREIYRLLRNYAGTSRACVLFCTEVLEIFEAADRVHVVTKGRISRPLAVADYPNVEALATEITRLEGESRQAVPAAMM